MVDRIRLNFIREKNIGFRISNYSRFLYEEDTKQRYSSFSIYFKPFSIHIGVYGKKQELPEVTWKGCKVGVGAGSLPSTTTRVYNG